MNEHETALIDWILEELGQHKDLLFEKHQIERRLAEERWQEAMGLALREFSRSLCPSDPDQELAALLAQDVRASYVFEAQCGCCGLSRDVSVSITEQPEEHLYQLRQVQDTTYQVYLCPRCLSRLRTTAQPTEAEALAYHRWWANHSADDERLPDGIQAWFDADRKRRQEEQQRWEDRMVARIVAALLAERGSSPVQQP